MGSVGCRTLDRAGLAVHVDISTQVDHQNLPLQNGVGLDGLNHPGILAAAALGGIDNERSFLECYAR